jgi:hypothetical protein
MSGLLAVSFSQIAAAQPDQAGATVIQQRGTQNTNQMGSDNQSTQVYGNENQATTQSGEQNQSAVGTGNQSSQAGEGGSASTGASSDDDERKRDNQGWHKGWEKNKHRDQSSGKYHGGSR